jgi:hypothetical protein
MAAGGLGGYAVLHVPNTEADDKRARIAEKKYKLMMLDATLTTVESVFNRNYNMADPVTRYILFLDKLYLILDIGFSFSDVAFKKLTEEFEENDDGIKLSLSYETRIKKLIKDTQEQMKKLSMWIQNPVYGPDHPLGNSLMENAKQNYESRAVEHDKGKEKEVKNTYDTFDNHTSNDE